MTPTSAPLRAPAAPPSASCREPPSPEPKRGAGGERWIEGGQGWLRPRRREASGSVADTLSRPGSEPEPEGGSGPTWAPEGGAWQGGWGRDAASGSGGRGSAAGTTSESSAPRGGVCVSGAGGYSCKWVWARLFISLVLMRSTCVKGHRTTLFFSGKAYIPALT